jgi:transcriptional regulator with XRE-family HTH domain
VLSGYWTPTAAFLATVSHHLGLPKETLFTEKLLEDSERPRVLRVADDGRARRARIGRFGRQPADQLLRERLVRRVDLVTVTGCSEDRIGRVLNGSEIPTPSLVDAVAGLLDLAPSDLFTAELLEASRVRTRVGSYGPLPSRTVGPYGRQPAYWLLRERGIRHEEHQVLRMTLPNEPATQVMPLRQNDAGDHASPVTADAPPEPASCHFRATSNEQHGVTMSSGVQQNLALTCGFTRMPRSAKCPGQLPKLRTSTLISPALEVRNMPASASAHRSSWPDRRDNHEAARWRWLVPHPPGWPRPRGGEPRAKG